MLSSYTTIAKNPFYTIIPIHIHSKYADWLPNLKFKLSLFLIGQIFETVTTQFSILQFDWLIQLWPKCIILICGEFSKCCHIAWNVVTLSWQCVWVLWKRMHQCECETKTQKKAMFTLKLSNLENHKNIVSSPFC